MLAWHGLNPLIRLSLKTRMRSNLLKHFNLFDVSDDYEAVTLLASGNGGFFPPPKCGVDDPRE